MLIHRQSKTCFGLALIVCWIASGCDNSSAKPKPNAETTLTKPTAAQITAMKNRVEALSENAKVISEVTDNIFQLIADGKGETVYENLTSDKFRSVATKEKFNELCERVSNRLGKLLNKQETQWYINPENGTYTASAAYKGKFEKGDGTISVIFERGHEHWLLLRLNIIAAQLLDDPSQFRQPMEFYVENSEPAHPGEGVDVWDNGQDPPVVISKNVPLLNVRWKVKRAMMKPTAPLKGFVTLSLKNEELETIRAAKHISIRKHIAE